jgi:CubicO group peptidase (beta-lactamase class C family)
MSEPVITNSHSRDLEVSEGYWKRTLSQRIAGCGVPGAVVGICTPGHRLIVGAGAANLRTGEPADQETRFQIGSITKVLTTLEILQQCERHSITPDTGVAELIPGIIGPGGGDCRDVSLRHLMSHSAGWEGDLNADTGRGDDALARYIKLLPQLRRLTTPGVEFSYCNAGFAVLGRILELLCGSPYEHIVQSGVCHQLGLATARFFAEEVITEPVALGYEILAGAPSVAKPWAAPRSVHPRGGVIATCSDVLRIGEAFLPDRKSPQVSATIRRMMTTPGLPAETGAIFGERIGLAWMVTGSGDNLILSHTGSMHGQRSTLLALPQRAVVLAVLANSSGGDHLGRLIAADVLDQIGLSRAAAKPASAPNANMRPATGRYTSPLGSLTIEDHHGLLRATLLPPGRLRAAHPEPDPVPPMDLQFDTTDQVLRVSSGPFEGRTIELIQHGQAEFARFEGRLWSAA